MSLPTFGEWLAMYLDDRGLTQGHFAQQIGISRTYLSDVIRDRCNPSRRVVNAISATTGVNVDMLSVLADLCPPNLRTWSLEDIEGFFGVLKEGK